MDPALLVTAAAAVVVALVVVLCALLVVLSGRRRLVAELAESRSRLEELDRRLESLQAPRPAQPVPPVRADKEYLITSVGRPAEQDVAEPAAAPVSAQQFASVAVGESLVRLLSLGYGVRRALSAESRNRIRFQMRQQVKASRRQRRRDLREARRTLRNQAGSGPDAAAEDAA